MKKFVQTKEYCGVCKKEGRMGEQLEFNDEGSLRCTKCMTKCPNCEKEFWRGYGIGKKDAGETGMK